MPVILYPLLLLIAGCGTGLALRTKEGNEYTTGPIKAFTSKKNPTPEDARKELVHAADVYCRSLGWLPETSEPVISVESSPAIRYDRCESVRSFERRVCADPGFKDAQVVEDPKGNGCWIMFNCKITEEINILTYSGFMVFRCYK